MPKVSVIIPVLNGERFVRDAIESVLSQTFQDFEIIVVDDGSTDRTGEVVKTFGSKVIYKYQANAGADKAYNEGIAIGSGESFAFLDHDDRWYPDKLATQVALLDLHSHVGLTYSEVDDVDEGGRPIRKRTWAERRGVHHDLVGDFRAVLKRKFPVAVPSAMMIRREILEKIGGFDCNLPAAGGYGDVEMCVLAGEISRLYFMVRPLAQYRVHKWQMTHQRRDEMYVNYIAFLDRLWNRWKDSPDKRALLLPHYGRYWSKLGREELEKRDWMAASKHLWVSLRYRPTYPRTWLALVKLQFKRLVSHSSP
ncbi:MAG TPA: glycosyltransferase [Candidatus Binatia bacterium]|jgi:glycosyltransferase involved in cell wall biosynthesis|nr:glycosyltransferase [Candidatus Binatia bacterium]